MMSNIFTGAGLHMFYNEDVQNTQLYSKNNVEINEVAEFPQINTNNGIVDVDTYDSEYNSKLPGEISVEPFNIVVNYLPDDPTHQFLMERAKDQSEFQMIVQYRTG
ncbi:TPA: hypothetical protein MFE81_003158 [Klebsiella pneumoniae]|nr:hypothetical protein [Klebsiella pneumoniae]HBW7417052.1 hypothetical protein [Klebsiella pneumoniae]HBW7526786.1 hypothetical protein [Klebsiella pneumoniae]HBW7761412.1 hypothetical protein [Klebsiella pneumoniae]HBW7819936.1 hypothetical protein [Klebsiella pneumoniae]